MATEALANPSHAVQLGSPCRVVPVQVRAAGSGNPTAFSHQVLTALEERDAASGEAAPSSQRHGPERHWAMSQQRLWQRESEHFQSEVDPVQRSIALAMSQASALFPWVLYFGQNEPVTLVLVSALRFTHCWLVISASYSSAHLQLAGKENSTRKPSIYRTGAGHFICILFPDTNISSCLSLNLLKSLTFLFYF